MSGRMPCRNILASLRERTSGGALSLGPVLAVGNLQVSGLSSSVVREQKWGDHMATRPTPDLLATLEREQTAVTPGSRQRPQLLATDFVFCLRQMRRLHSCPNSRIIRDALERTVFPYSVTKASELSSCNQELSREPVCLLHQDSEILLSKIKIYQNTMRLIYRFQICILKLQTEWK